jgi:Xaa-Pro aminopeptidase
MPISAAGSARYRATGWVDGAFEAVPEPGMVLCVEVLVSPESGDFSIKIEDQVLITKDGAENLTRHSFDHALCDAC